jgi:hypothetical protein
MIVQEIFTVIGKTYVDDDIIFCRHLVFTTPGECSLVILPKKGALPGAQRMLKIVTDEINSVLAPGVAEITYNLDGDITVPLLDNGLDPETPPLPVIPPSPSKTGAKGGPDFWQGPIPPADTATPNFWLPDPIGGSYPKAEDGGDGKAGGKGGKGVKGVNGPTLEIWVKQINGDVEIDLKGQQGGDGGQGGNGQFGGKGQNGALAVSAIDSNWLGVPTSVCKEGPGLGGTGGRGGNAGCGGDGGDGGNGGNLKVFFVAGADLTKLHRNLQKGVGGSPGHPGTEGKGGPAGTPGVNITPCLPALSSQDGPGGDPCRQGDAGEKGGISQSGKDGKDGQYITYQVTSLPHVSSLWP